MKRAAFILAFLLSAVALICQTAEESKPAKKLDTKKDKISYAIGYNIGAANKKILSSTDVDSMLKGLRDAVNGTEPTKITKDELPKIVRQFQDDFKKKEEERLKIAGEKNKIEGDAFLKGNAGKEGIKTTASGMQYTVLKEGAGAKPGPDDTVTIHYQGWLIDGTQFHNSRKDGKPVTFPLANTFPGWGEALRMMKVGDKWKTFLPPELAFGARGLGDKVGPNAVIIFEIELLDIKPVQKEEK